MKIALFDDILEAHVCVALEAAIRRLGHETYRTGSLWRGHGFPHSRPVIDAIDAAVDRVIGERCHALLNFRASALTPSHVTRLSRAGIRTAVWFHDDPVLYRLTYQYVTDGYDVVLHCGTQGVLRYYDLAGHRKGLNFPFWVDPKRWRYGYRPECAVNDVVFFGHATGASTKVARYGRLSVLAGRLAVYGKVDRDPDGIHRGELHGVEAAASVLARYRLGLNLPQRFADYAGSGYDFPGLSRFGSFFLASRVSQYASIGLPVLTLPTAGLESHFPAAITLADEGRLLATVDEHVSDHDALRQRSREGRLWVERHHSADARARMLIALLHDRLRADELSLYEREFAYQAFPADGTDPQVAEIRRSPAPPSIPAGFA